MLSAKWILFVHSESNIWCRSYGWWIQIKPSDIPILRRTLNEQLRRHNWLANFRQVLTLTFVRAPVGLVSIPQSFRLNCLLVYYHQIATKHGFVQLPTPTRMRLHACGRVHVLRIMFTTLISLMHSSNMAKKKIHGAWIFCRLWLLKVHETKMIGMD